MILYNPTLADTMTDNHWLPTVHLADGAEFLAFMRPTPAPPPRSRRRDGHGGTGDVMAAFSSRGPGGHVHQARHHRARRADPGRPHADAGSAPRAARPASTSRRSPAPRCRRRTSPARRSCSRRCTRLDPGPDQVGADDHGDTEVVKEDRTTPGRSVRHGAGRVDLTRRREPRADVRRDAAEHGRAGRRPDRGRRISTCRRSTRRSCRASCRDPLASATSRAGASSTTSHESPPAARSRVPQRDRLDAGGTGRSRIMIETSAPTAPVLRRDQLAPRTPG